MKKMRRVLSLILAVSMMMSLLVFTAAAESVNAVVVSVPDVEATAGGTVNVDINVDNNPGFISMLFGVEYDDTVFRLTGVTDSTGWPSGAHDDRYENVRSPYYLSWNGDILPQNVTKTGKIVTLTFEVSANAMSGEYDLKLIPGEVVDFDLKEVGQVLNDGHITVKGGKCIHNFVNNVCTICGHANVAVKTVSLTLSGEIGVNFFASVPDTAKVEGAYMEIAVNDKITRIPFSETLEKNKNGYYKFSGLTGSVQMADEIKVTYHYMDGGEERVSDTLKYSVKSYLDYIRNNSSSQPAAVVQLAEAITDYGYYAQQMFSRVKGWEIGKEHAVMDRVNILTPADRPDLTDYAIAVSGSATGISVTSYSLELDADTSVFLYFTPNGAGSHTFKVDGVAVQPVLDGENRYKVVIPNIKALVLDKTHTVTVDDSLTVEVSPFSYANSVMKFAWTEDYEKDAMTALYNYWVASKAYKEYKDSVTQ